MKMPSKPGVYLAKDDGYEWWNVIAIVEGTSPFLRCFVVRLDDEWHNSLIAEHPEELEWGRMVTGAGDE